MKIFKNRTFIGITAIVLSLLFFFGVGRMVLGNTAKQISVTRAAKSISKDTKITDDMLETVTVGGYNMPSDVVTDRAQIVGKYATMGMITGDYVLSSKLSSTPLGADEYLSKLDGKKMAVSVSIKNFANGLSGKLETGDIISVDVVDYGDLKQTLNNGALQYVKLLAATADTGTDNDRSAAAQKSSKDTSSSKENMPSTLTVLATPDQKKLLEDYNANGTIHAALVYRGDAKTAQAFLDAQDKYLAEHTASSQQGGTGNGK